MLFGVIKLVSSISVDNITASTIIFLTFNVLFLLNDCPTASLDKKSKIHTMAVTKWWLSY